MNFFITFTGHSKQSLSLTTPVILKRPFPIARTNSVCSHFRRFMPRTHCLTVVVFRVQTLGGSNLQHQIHPHFHSPIHLLLLLLTLRENLPRLMAKLVVSLHFFPSSPWVSQGNDYFFNRKRVLVCILSFCFLLLFSQRNLQKVSFLPMSVDCTRFFLSNFSSYG